MVLSLVIARSPPRKPWLTLNIAALLDATNEVPTAGAPRDGQTAGEDSGNDAGERVPLSSIKAVAAHLPFIDAARSKVTTDMEAMVFTGLATLVSPFSYLSNGRWR